MKSALRLDDVFKRAPHEPVTTGDKVKTALKLLKVDFSTMDSSQQILNSISIYRTMDSSSWLRSFTLYADMCSVPKPSELLMEATFSGTIYTLANANASPKGG